MTLGDTIAAIATAQGRGGVAVIRVSGSESAQVAERLTGRPVDAGRIAVRKIFTGATVIDKAVVLFFKAPHSYTGEDVLEIQCHGGVVTPRRILDACFAAGARLARRGEFTERAFLNGRLDYDQAESVLDLIDAKTVRAADAALAGLSGNRRREITALYDSALELSTRIEHALDVDEGELPDGFLEEVAAGVASLRNGIESTLRRMREGHLLRTGALVVLAGPPNAGKSSLMNALLETNRAIVSDIPGTTRDTIEESLDLDGWPIRLVDTAGLRETDDGIEEEGVKRAEELLEKADVVLWLGEDKEVCEREIHLHAKCDLGRGEGINVSAKTGEGLDELKREIVARIEQRIVAADSGESGFDTSPLQESLAILTLSDNTDGDLVIAANAVRMAAEKIGAMTGARYESDLLEKLFTRFCVGK